ncbi:hypothetical protein [Streptomyces sp. H51]|uniref:hypothetical protein n=1 Tax=Streptomyces sp. H51 TaxID=3111770 RepID=UPI002D776312|nr:hypothetical protein [Streptomyces sp. H51]
MRLSRSLAPVTVAVALVLALPYEAASLARATAGDPDPAQPFGAECRSRVTGSHVVAYCHNPYPQTDRVSLHVECARWWDLDTDAAGVDVDPAATVRLTARCWKEVAAVWISHRRA